MLMLKNVKSVDKTLVYIMFIRCAVQHVRGTGYKTHTTLFTNLVVQNREKTIT